MLREALEKPAANLVNGVEMPIVDHVLGVQASSIEHVNECITLNCLGVGLATLANQVRLLEEPIQSYETTNRKRIHLYGFDNLAQFGLPQEAEQLLPCYFHWFGTSLCNYARLVGFLYGIEAKVFSRNAVEDKNYFRVIKKHCDDYVSSIPEIAAVKKWRNKVFAHFSITDPNGSDNAAMLDSSVMSPIQYQESRFRVGGIIHMSRGAEAELPQWSVSEMFDAVAPRFWPSMKE